MFTGLKTRNKKVATTRSRKETGRMAGAAEGEIREPLEETTRTQAQQPPRDVELAAVHAVGKPAEIEPREYAATPAEEPEAAMRSAEAPDAGYGRCTESSDWENRGRS